jgi:hypothetical protein
LGLSQRQFFISSAVKAHWARFLSGRFAKGQLSIFRPQLGEDLAAGVWDEAVSHLANVEQLVAVVVADDGWVERVIIGRFLIFSRRVNRCIKVPM